jgi:hypothetical protein
MDPDAFNKCIRPALSDRRGRALFIGTPKGHNHFYDRFQKASRGKDPEWAAYQFTTAWRHHQLTNLWRRLWNQDRAFAAETDWTIIRNFFSKWKDGSYLAELLLSKGYFVHGIIRRSSSFNTARIDHIY